jgi:hypothetical protein
MERPKTLDPECSKCRKPMVWHSEQSVGPLEVNVFECKVCKKLSAVSIGPASKRAGMV